MGFKAQGLFGQILSNMALSKDLNMKLKMLGATDEADGQCKTYKKCRA